MTQPPDLDLTPTQDLFIEVLAARHRLGEHFWTFSTAHMRTAKQLEALHLVSWHYGNTPRTLRAHLTDAGREYALSSDYTPPILRSNAACVSAAPDLSTTI